jgi:uncharacterized membrane protein YbhN (UPF0104 family)
VNAVQTVLAVLFGAACLYTVLGYPHRYGALTGRSRLFRTVGLSLLVLFLGLVLLYTFLDFEANTASKKIAALRQITYLAACFFLALSLLCIALLDWLEAIVFYRREQRDLLRQMARDEMERIAAREVRDAPGEVKKNGGSGGEDAAGGGGGAAGTR